MKEFSFESYLKKRYSEKTTIGYLDSVERFISENKGNENYTHEQVVDYFYSLKHKNLTSSYRIKILTAIKHYYEFLYTTNQRKDHPCKRLKIQDTSLKGIHFDELFTPEELEALMQMPERYALIGIKNKIVLSLLIHQALTGEEITTLKLNDVDLDGGLIKIKPSAKLSGRTLEFHRTQFMLFMRYMNEVRPLLIKDETNKLLVTKNGTPETIDNIHAMLKGLQKFIPPNDGSFGKKNLTPSHIRQSVIANWLNLDQIPLADVQLMAGHKWPSSTEKYIRNDLAEKKRLINLYHPLEKMDF